VGFGGCTPDMKGGEVLGTFDTTKERKREKEGENRTRRLKS
jgi:hypothetical protein